MTTHTSGAADLPEALHRVIDDFERRERGIPQAHIAAALVTELRATLTARAISVEPARAVSETVNFTDQSTVSPIEKARRYLTHVANKKPNNPYFFDDGYPRESVADDAAAALSVLEQLAASHGQAPAQPDQPIACSYGDNGYACCEGGPCQADVHNDKLAEQQAPATAQADSVLEDALSDAVRVPLDSLHADAAYLIGRLQDGSMPYVRVIEIIRERIDAAKAAIRARASHGQAPADLSPTAGMNIAQRILHVGGRNNDAGYVEFGSIQAVEALVRQVLRDLPAPAPADSVQEDAARLDWLLLRISGAEFRRLGVHYPGNASRADVDAARKQGATT